MYNRDGKSRKFGFVGFRTEQEVGEAIKYFDKSFMDNDHIICEIFSGVAHGWSMRYKNENVAAATLEVNVAPSPSPSENEFAPSPPPTADDNNHQDINSKMWTISLVFLFFALLGILFVIVKKFVLEIKQRLHDSATIVVPLLGNTEMPLPSEAPSRPLPENYYVL